MNARAIVLATHKASVDASDESKQRARKAAMTLRKTEGAENAFNAVLNLIARGAPTTETQIVAESRRIAKATEGFAMEQRAKRERREAA